MAPAWRETLVGLMAPITVAERSPLLPVAAWIGLLVLVLGLSLRGWGTFQVGAYQDDATYVVLARSIAFGPNYGMINEPGPPPPSKFPFGLPLTLAPLVRLLPNEPLVYTLVSLAATVLNISLLFWGWPLLAPGTSRWWGVASGWLYGVSPLVIGHTRMVMSEPLFTTFVLLALLLTEAHLRTGAAHRWRLPALGVILMLALFTRWIGVTVAGAVVARLALADWRAFPKRLAAVLSGAVGSLALALLLTPIDLQQLIPGRHLQSRQERLEGQSEKRGRARPYRKTSADYVTTEVRRLLVAVGSGDREDEMARRLGLPYLPRLFGMGVSALVAYGAWYGFRRGRLAPSLILFEVLYAGVILFWPFIHARLLYPLLPFLAVQLLIGAQAFCVAAATPWPSAARLAAGIAPALALLLAALALVKSSRVEDSRALTGDLRLGADWLAQHTAPAAVVMAQSPPTVFLYSQRATLPYPKPARMPEVADVLLANGADYLLLEPAVTWGLQREYSPYVSEALVPAIAALEERGRLTLIYQAPSEPLVRVYRMEREGR